MARGTIRPKGWDDYPSEDCPRPATMTVDDRVEVDTGLVSADGHRIYRVQAPVGFGRDEEW